MDWRSVLDRGLAFMAPCCKGVFLERSLLCDFDNTPLRPERLFDEDWRRVLESWARVFQRVGSIAALERRDRRSKAVATQQDMVYDRFVWCVCSRKQNFVISVEAISLDPSPSPPPPPLEDPKPKRGMSAAELYTQDNVAEEKVLIVSAARMCFSTGWRATVPCTRLVTVLQRPRSNRCGERDARHLCRSSCAVALLSLDLY